MLAEKVGIAIFVSVEYEMQNERERKKTIKRFSYNIS